MSGPAKFKPYQDYLRACKRTGTMPRTFDSLRKSCPPGVTLEAYVKIAEAMADKGKRM